jgi:hypothetical protein
LILFLDIDGVLHPDPTTQEFAFCKAELLYELILDITNLKIVISSDWRKYHTIEELRKFIFKNNIDYYEKIIGATPVIEELKFSYRGREQECLSWLKDNKIEGDWFAIDDVACIPSFTLAYGEALFFISRLKSLSQNKRTLSLSTGSTFIATYTPGLTPSVCKISFSFILALLFFIILY